MAEANVHFNFTGFILIWQADWPSTQLSCICDERERKMFPKILRKIQPNRHNDPIHPHKGTIFASIFKGFLPSEIPGPH
jgi:hypothetical protein